MYKHTSKIKASQSKECHCKKTDDYILQHLVFISEYHICQILHFWIHDIFTLVVFKLTKYIDFKERTEPMI